MGFITVTQSGASRQINIDDAQKALGLLKVDFSDSKAGDTAAYLP